jgi:sigma-E factor negative regulatory protein RseA
MDGEAIASDEFAEIAREQQARATWARYHLIGDVLRDNVSEVAPATFAAQLAAKVGQEPTVLAPPRQERRSMRPSIWIAIAASVAALALIGVQQPASIPAGDISPAVAIDTGAAATIVAAQDDALPALPAEVLQEPFHSQRRLNSYLVKFNEQRSSLGVPSVNPYVRIVGFESE